MKIAFKTFGCKANSVDTDTLYLEAKRRGYEIVSEDEWADTYVINSCTVTSHADRDARVQVNKYKRQNPKALVGVIGCYAQVAKSELLAIPEVDFVLGTADKLSILDHLSQSLAGQSPERDQVKPTSGFLPETFRGSRYSRASIKIQDGCNFSCAFCIIPQARGRSRSLGPDLILKQIDDAYAQGFEEIILTGIHLAHYGWDINTSLNELLRGIFASPAGPRVRISTLDPFEFSDDLLDWLGTEKRLCPHFHIALQSGSDEILKRMRRIYRAQEFIDVTRKIHDRNPDTFVGVDIIVGFPGETEEAFQQTVSVLKNSFWSKLHVFSFSLRAGTRAQALDGHLHPSIITERSHRLRELSQQRYQEFLKSQIGKQKDVLLERPSSKHDGIWLGHTENYLPTYSRLKNGIPKQIISSRIAEAEGERVWTAAR